MCICKCACKTILKTVRSLKAVMHIQIHNIFSSKILKVQIVNKQVILAKTDSI